MTVPTTPSTYPVAGIPVTEITFDDALQRLLHAPTTGERLAVHFITAHTIVEASARTPVGQALTRALQEAQLVAADGMPLAWVGRLQRRRVTRVCGPDLMPALIDAARTLPGLDHGAERGGRHYLYGGAPGVPERLAEALRQRFPGVEIVGAYSPPFHPLTTNPTPEQLAQRAADIERINAAQPDYVWVGLGTPKQDLWIHRCRGELDAAALLAVGAAFNIHTGDLRRAPRWMQRAGLEWLFRLLMEPRRLLLRYTTINARFLVLVARQALRAGLRRRA